MGLFRFLNQWREKKDGTLEGPALSTGAVRIGDGHYSAKSGDTPSIMEAIEQAKADTGPDDGATIWIPPGDYPVDIDTNIIPRGEDASYLTIRGFGMATRLYAIDDSLDAGAGAGGMVRIDSSGDFYEGTLPTECVVENLWLDGQGHILSNPAWVYNGKHCGFRGIYASNHNTADASENGGGFIDLGSNAQNCFIEGCVAWPGPSGDSLQGLVHAHGAEGTTATMRKNRLYNAADQASNSWAILGVDEADGIIEGNEVHNGQIATMEGTKAKRNHINNEGTSVKSLRIAESSAQVKDPGSKIVDNTLRGGDDQIDIPSTLSYNIENNVIKRNDFIGGSRAIVCNLKATDMTFDGNEFSGQSSDVILLNNGWDGVNVKNNEIESENGVKFLVLSPGSTATGELIVEDNVSDTGGVTYFVPPGDGGSVTNAKFEDNEVNNGTGVYADASNAPIQLFVKDNDFRGAGTPITLASGAEVFPWGNHGYNDALSSPPSKLYGRQKYFDDGTNTSSGNPAVAVTTDDGTTWNYMD